MGNHYCQVNVYRGSGRWILVAWIKAPGRPLPQTIARRFERVLALDASQPLSEALEVASDVLLAEAERVRATEGR